MTGKEATAAFVQWLRVEKLIQGSHGKRTGAQLPVTLEMDGTMIAKPRLLVVDPKRLAKKMEAES
jgi:hypothetical protein